jgi:hypothetical protein
MDLNFQGQKTECFYHIWIKFYVKGYAKKLHRFKKCVRTVKRTVRKKYALFKVSQERVEISQKFKQIWIQQAEGIIQKKIT